MTPMLGILASQMSGHLGNPIFNSIQTVSVGVGGASSIVFTSIPNTYKHLQIRGIMRSTYASSGFVDMYIADTTPSSTATIGYTHILIGNGTAAAGQTYNASYIEAGRSSVPGLTATANVFGSAIIDILDYNNASKSTTYRSFAGGDLNGSGNITLSSGLQTKTLGISQLTLTVDGTFSQYSQFALYGIKG